MNDFEKYRNLDTQFENNSSNNQKNDKLARGIFKRAFEFFNSDSDNASLWLFLICLLLDSLFEPSVQCNQSIFGFLAGLMGISAIGSGIKSGINSGMQAGLNEQQFEHQKYLQHDQQQFNAAQAEVARDWQERMYNQYYSPAATINQYQQAGLNPALMYKSAAPGSMPSSSAATSSQGSATAGSVAGGSFSVGELVRSAYELKTYKNQIKLQEEEIRNKQADTLLKDSEVNLNKTASDLNISKKEYVELQRTFDPYIWANEIKQGDLNMTLTKAQITAVRTSISQMNSETLKNIVHSYCEKYNLKLTDAEYNLLKQKTATEKAVDRLTWKRVETENTLQMKYYAEAMRDNNNNDPEDNTWSNILPIIVGAVSAYVLKGPGPKPVGGFKAY